MKLTPKEMYSIIAETYNTLNKLQDEIDTKILSRRNRRSDEADAKRRLHISALQTVCEECKVNIPLAYKILMTFKSPKKWELNNGWDDCFITGHCSYSGFGTLYAQEEGLWFIAINGTKTVFQCNSARM